MSECRRFEAMIENLDPPELDARAPSPLLAHAHNCEDCGRLLAIHRELAAAGSKVPEPDEVELELRHEHVLRAIRRRRSHRPIRVAAIAAGVILAFSAGLLAGRTLPSPAGGPGPSSRLIDTLHAEAASNRGLGDVEDSPFTYSNVSFHRLAGDRIALDFDVTTHLGVVERARSPLVREVLSQSLLNPSSIGERLKTMSLAAGELGPKLEQAVVFALGHDESVAVRLAAVAVLAGRRDDDVQSALMTALREDPSVQVRLTTLDALVRDRVDHRRIRETIRQRPGDQALMVRLAELERQPQREEP